MNPRKDKKMYVIWITESEEAAIKSLIEFGKKSDYGEEKSQTIVDMFMEITQRGDFVKRLQEKRRKANEKN